ncbi:hypothetical protein Q6D67_13970 [Haliea sp. E1-2-M8]|uniref:hypothetical protein n=1 Tax=Haliea sp. E1-2-M8 TaxID=3064706 RepID=UPI00271C6111|nr:hypothetical protein [Haliea sp. E1-2-M8]MDO8862813.1 hypothetical protein [Haliea sp. E1-2-M8]
MVMLLIAGIPVTMVLAATWLWWFVVRGDLDIVELLGTANRGTLLDPPRELAAADLAAPSGTPLPWTNTDRQWTLLVTNSGPECGTSCEYKLYLTRQIHMALGKEFPRVRRMLITDRALTDTALAVSALSDGKPVPTDFSQLLAREHAGLSALRLDAAAWPALFPEAMAAAESWYLVDPAGWVMMAYAEDDSYKDVISDLKFLLKNSGD